MFVRLASDLHLEFGDFDLPSLPEDKDTILILAGDVGLVDKPYTFQYFLHEMADRFAEVIYILGNHEFYKYSFVKALPTLDNMFATYDNISVIDNHTLVFGEVAFICSTLWTSFDNANPIVMNEARASMNDYRLIRTGTPENPYIRRLQPTDTFVAHRKAVDYIFPAIKEQKELDHKVVVVTHHGPSYMSVEEQFKGQTLNGAYVTELYEQILETQPEYWLHGHTHSSLDYNIGKTRVLCNPRGYYSVESNPKFDPYFRFEV